jgi:hypothetical protein
MLCINSINHPTAIKSSDLCGGGLVLLGGVPRELGGDGAGRVRIAHQGLQPAALLLLPVYEITSDDKEGYKS